MARSGFTGIADVVRGFWVKGPPPAARRAARTHIVSRATPIEYSPRMLAALAPLFAAFGLVLAIACANVSNKINTVCVRARVWASA